MTTTRLAALLNQDVNAIADGLLNVVRSYWGPDNGPIDVRLQVFVDADNDTLSWAIRSGDHQYDTDHNGYWGADSIDEESDTLQVAEQLIDDVCDDFAQSGEAE